MKKEYQQFEMPLTDAVVKDACEMSSLNFQEIYIEKGHDPNKVAGIWLAARRSSKGAAFMKKIYNKFPGFKNDPNKVVRVEVTKADQKAAAEASGNQVEAGPVKGIRASTNPKITEARKHFDAGVTRKQDLAAAMGISEGYAYKLLKTLKSE